MSIQWKHNINQSVGKKVEKYLTIKNTGVFLHEWKPQPVTWAYKIYHIIYIVYTCCPFDQYITVLQLGWEKGRVQKKLGTI